MQTKNKRNYLKENGITLIALVVIIVVFLILAGVSVNALFGNGGIIKKAQNIQGKIDQAIEDEKISVILAEWNLINETEETTFEKFMKEKFGEDKVEIIAENEVIVTMESENRYKVKTDGTITSTKCINIDKNDLTLELQKGETITGTLTASLSDITGEITWSNSDNAKATISSTKGESITITAVATGTTIITATCEDYTATCKVTVIAVGSYVEYDVSYTDIYSGIEYTKTTGWRYLGKDDVGNQLIVSTGIPARLYYHYNSNIGNKIDEGANSWWATKAEISATTTDTLYQTTNGYDYNNSGEPNKYAAYGLRYKFDKIPFTNSSEKKGSTANEGIFIKVGDTTSGTNISLNFKADGVDVVDIHNLTLAELNRATNKASGTTRADTNRSSGFLDLTGTALGLFNMQNLTGYTKNYYYWLATPFPNYNDYLCCVFCSLSGVYVGSGNDYGVRPVISLPSNANLTIIENGDV